MPKINLQHLSAAIIQTNAMDFKQKQAVVEEIFKEQPNLLTSVLVQNKMGNSMEDADVLLNMLLVFHVALRGANIKIATISMEEMERQLQLMAAQIKFSEGMHDSYIYDSVKQYMKNNDEEYLLAFAWGEMINAKFLSKKHESSKYLLTAGLNMVNCIANAQYSKTE